MSENELPVNASPETPAPAPAIPESAPITPVAEVAPAAPPAVMESCCAASAMPAATPEPAAAQPIVETATATATAPPPAIDESTAAGIQVALDNAKAGSELVTRRIVIRRDRWEALLSLAAALKSQRGVEATPTEVAAIVLDAGLKVVLEEAQATKKAKAARAKAPKAKAPKAKLAKAQRAAKARSFSPAELGAIRSLVRGLKSQRAVQRTLALWLGAQAAGSKLAVALESLRSLCREFKVYDTANFAQNMKKDAAFFAEVRDRSGNRLGWSLTAKGSQAAKALLK